MNITTGTDLRAKLATRKTTYTLPVLDITIEYRKPDLLKLSLNNSLPQVLAEQVLTVYKEGTKGTDKAQIAETLKNKVPEVDEKFLAEIRDKGYVLLSQLCTSHKILDVPESDPENNLIAWADVPEEDAIAFVFTLIDRASVTETREGTEVNLNDLENFSDGESVSKRNTTRKSR